MMTGRLSYSVSSRSNVIDLIPKLPSVRTCMPELSEDMCIFARGRGRCCVGYVIHVAGGLVHVDDDRERRRMNTSEDPCIQTFGCPRGILEIGRCFAGSRQLTGSNLCRLGAVVCAHLAHQQLTLTHNNSSSSSSNYTAHLKTYKREDAGGSTRGKYHVHGDIIPHPTRAQLQHCY